MVPFNQAGGPANLLHPGTEQKGGRPRRESRSPMIDMTELIRGTEDEAHAHLMPGPVAAALGELGARWDEPERISQENIIREHVATLNREVIRLRRITEARDAGQRMGEILARGDKARKLAEGVLPFLLRDQSQRFEMLAERFWQETGVMAPGKDVPAALAFSQPPFDARCAAYEDWLEKEINALKELAEAVQ